MFPILQDGLGEKVKKSVSLGFPLESLKQDFALWSSYLLILGL